MPIGLIMRKMYGTFNEYHNSLDDKNFISFKTIMSQLKFTMMCSALSIIISYQ